MCVLQGQGQLVLEKNRKCRAYLVGSRLVLGGKLDLTRRSLRQDEDAILLPGGDGPVKMRRIRRVVLEVELVLLADVLYQNP